MHVPEGVEARPRDFQCIAQRPKSLLNNFAGGSVRPACLVHEEKPLATIANHFPKHLRKILRNRNCAFAPYGLRRLYLAVPRGDTATPAGRMVFTVLGAVAELERSLIAERVRAGLRNARAKGKRLGRPRVAVDRTRIARFRAQGLSWAKIAAELGIGEGTVYRLAHASAKNRPSQSAPSQPCRSTCATRTLPSSS